MRLFAPHAPSGPRTPPPSTRGYWEMLRPGAAGPPADADLARPRIEEESIRMTGLVDDMLVLARLDQGRPLEQEPVDLQAIATDPVADARVVAPQRAINLTSSGTVALHQVDTR